MNGKFDLNLNTGKPLKKKQLYLVITFPTIL